MNQAGEGIVTERDIEDFNKDGVVCLRRVLDDGWVERMRGAVDRVTENPGPMRESYYPDRPGDFFSEKFLWTVDEDFRSYVFDAPVAASVGRVMGTRRLNFFYDHLLVKEPGTDSATEWHQDSNFWPFSGSQIATLWAPLDRATRDNGVLEFVRGSHLWHDRPMSRPTIFGDRDGKPQDVTDEGAGSVDDTPEQPDIQNNRDQFDIVTWDLDPGDALVFTGLTLHYASGNPTEGRRRGLATRWLGDDIRFMRKKKMLQLIRDPGLEDGNRVDCDLFPVVWRADEAA
ncbi:MAG: phytanoyl-CoA dioxygenase family protein [Rhodospirillales bacterium]|jgi:ectoine hydroxylase-related dioxygenase (phytanoyl-CoA dioxygenase family)|nr:phytanoyl-CoA dioxygenase family protein [Rhodospirillales bacterium]